MEKEASAELDSNSLPPEVDKPTLRKRLGPYLPVLLSLASVLGLQPLFALVQTAILRRRFKIPSTAELVAKGLAETFDSAVIGDSSIKKDLGERIRLHALAYAELESWRLVIIQVLSLIKYIAFFVLISSFASWVHQYYQFPSPEAESEIVSGAVNRCFLLLLILVVPQFLLMLLAMLVAIRATSQKKSIEQTAFRLEFIVRIVGKWPLVVTIVYFIWGLVLQRIALNEGLRPDQHINYLALLLTLIVVVVLRLISAMGQLSNYLINHLKSKQDAESLIAIHLLGLLQLLKSRPPIGESRRRRMVIVLLEDIAVRLESSLPKQIIGTDLSSAPLREGLARIGGGIRSLKRRVAIPTSNSWDEELRQELSDFLIKFLSLRWAALPTAEVEKISATSILSQGKLLIRTLVTAAIPSILLALLQASPWRLTGQRAEIALIVAVAWFALSIILRVDPDFTAKTKALKEIQDIVSLRTKT